jgi:glycosyltransferase involved in cell wall biosynthesis
VTTSASVIICTRARPGVLARCLTSVCAQGGGYEVVVVDNQPGEAATRSVTEAAGARYVAEPRRGSGPARNRGLEECRTDLVCYVDDDCQAEPGWLEALLRPFQDAAVHAVSGQVLPIELVTPSQRLFERYFPYSKGPRQRSWGRGSRSYPFPLNANEMGTGANMAFRRQTLSQLGGFVDALSAGGPARGGEDIQAFYAVLRAGYCLVYEPEARVRHPHPATPAQLDRVFFDYGVAHFAYLSHCLFAARDAQAIRRAAAILAYYGARLVTSNGCDLPRRYLLRHLAGSCLGPALYLVARTMYG